MAKQKDELQSSKGSGLSKSQRKKQRKDLCRAMGSLSMNSSPTFASDNKVSKRENPERTARPQFRDVYSAASISDLKEELKTVQRRIRIIQRKVKRSSPASREELRTQNMHEVQSLKRKCDELRRNKKGREVAERAQQRDSRLKLKGTYDGRRRSKRLREPKGEPLSHPLSHDMARAGGELAHPEYEQGLMKRAQSIKSRISD